VQKLNRDVNKVLADAEVSQRLRELGAIYDGPARRKTCALPEGGARALGKAVKDIGLQPE